FKLRGLRREELLERLGGDGEQPKAKKTKGKTKSPPVTRAEPASSAEALPVDPAAFWTGGALPEDWCGEGRTAPVSAALPKRLGNFPFWRGQQRFLDALEPLYRQASNSALEVFLVKPITHGAGHE